MQGARERAAREAARVANQKTQRFRALFLLSTFLLAVAGAAGVFAWLKQRDADRRGREAASAAIAIRVANEPDTKFGLLASVEAHRSVGYGREPRGRP